MTFNCESDVAIVTFEATTMYKMATTEGQVEIETR